MGLYDPGEILDLIEWLPPGSAFHAVLEAKGNAAKAHQLLAWTHESDLLLALAKLISHQTYVLAQVNSKKKLAEPKPIVGPRDTARKSGSGDATAMARAMMAAQK